MRKSVLKVENLSIEGVKLIRLNPIVDDRGYLIEILRRDDEFFEEFGQVYLSVCFPMVVKAWHAHKYQTDNFFVVKGHAKIGLFDGRESSKTYRKKDTVVLGEQAPYFLQIPPLVWHGQMALGNEPSFLINIPTKPYNHENPDELRKDPFDNDFNYDWQVKSR